MSNSPFVHKILSDTLLVNSTHSTMIVSMLEKIAMEHPEVTSPQAGTSTDEARADADGDFWSNYTWARPYNVQNGVLLIPVSGVLLNRFPYQLGSWATGYDYIREALNRGLGDEDVHSIALVVDSPGGVVSGCFDLCDDVFAMRGNKPIKAFVSDSAYSAAYALASSADTVTVTRSGGTGSIGVVTAHVDVSKSMEQMGVVHTFIFAGSHKVDGNPFEKLPKDVKARIQKRIDRIYTEFVNVVARNRNLGEDAVRQTEALTYDAQDSLEVGFADTVGKFDEELAAFELGTAKTEISAMTDKTHTVADVDAARNEGLNAGKQEAQDRVNTIMDSDEAKTRPIAARAMLTSPMGADEAVALLKSLPEESATAPATPAAVAPVAPAAAVAPATPAAAVAATPATPAAATQTPFDKVMGTDAPAVGANAGEGNEVDPNLTADQKEYRAMVALEDASATGTHPIQ